MSMELVGFIADLGGRESSVLWGDPVYDVDGERFVLRAGASTGPARVALVTERDNEYVHQTGTTRTLDALQEVDVVWLVGPKFFNEVGAIEELRPLWREINSWWTGSRGFRYRLGTLRGLQSFREKHSRIVREAICGWIGSGPPSSEWPRAEALLQIHGTLDTVPSVDRSVVRALVFWRFGRRESLRLEVQRLRVDSGLRAWGEFELEFWRTRRRLAGKPHQSEKREPRGLRLDEVRAIVRSEVEPLASRQESLVHAVSSVIAARSLLSDIDFDSRGASTSRRWQHEVGQAVYWASARTVTSPLFAQTPSHLLPRVGLNAHLMQVLFQSRPGLLAENRLDARTFLAAIEAAKLPNERERDD